MAQNAIYAQSGGVTAVINATAAGVIQTAQLHPNQIGKVFAAQNGILGVLNNQLFDCSNLSASELEQLYFTPGGAFGSCRYKVKTDEEFEKLISVFKEHNIGYFFYNGGGDSQDTSWKVSERAKNLGWPMQCIGIPKTIDNDLPLTDNSPGYGSVAKYVAISTLEASLDVASMARSSTKVFVLEVMGRHTGWIAAAAGLVGQNEMEAPHIILFPEITFDEKKFLAKVDETVKKCGFCVIVTSEGVRNEQGKFLSAQSRTDAFGHAQLGGVASYLTSLVQEKLGYKHHYAIADYLQRSARHIASQVDVDQAFALGKHAVEIALAGKHGVMPIIVRQSSNPYQWTIDDAPLTDVANIEKHMPKEFIRADGFGITPACREYILPLIQGEAYPPYINGLPNYLQKPIIDHGV
jgi:6-phosphofructokinase